MASPSATTSSDDLRDRFAALAQRGRAALVTYITAGHPTPDAAVALMRGLEAAGADVLEVGVPFSDPMADGPVIQEVRRPPCRTACTDRVLELVHEARLAIRWCSSAT